jgi:phage gp36-like protein
VATNYIDVDFFVAVLGARAIQTLLDDRRDDGIVAFDDVTNAAAIERAIKSAEGIADAKLGRRFTLAELQVIEQEDAVRSAVARIAAYELSSSAMGRSEQLVRDYEIQCKFLVAVGKGQYATGRSDPDPPPSHAELVKTASIRGLSGRW